MAGRVPAIRAVQQGTRLRSKGVPLMSGATL